MGKYGKRRLKAPAATGRIYTCRGDAGETDFPAIGRVPKNHPRLIAMGALDELNCAIGELVARIEEAKRTNPVAARSGPQCQAVLPRLKRVQRELFCLGSWLSGADRCRRGEPARLRTMTRRLEREIDAMEAQLPACEGFILPGGGLLASAAHLARAVCRRAERDCLTAFENAPSAPALVPYLNRLSDWLFVSARWLACATDRTVESWHRPIQREVRGKRS